MVDQASEQDTVQHAEAFPPPPPFFHLYAEGRDTDPPPPPRPVQGTYQMFGELHTVCSVSHTVDPACKSTAGPGELCCRLKMDYLHYKLSSYSH